jgi:hypothetical protein
MKAGQITISAADEDHTQVICAPAYTLKYGQMGSFMDRFYVRGTHEKGLQNQLRGLKDHVEGQTAATGALSRPVAA